MIPGNPLTVLLAPLLGDDPRGPEEIVRALLAAGATSEMVLARLDDFVDMFHLDELERLLTLALLIDRVSAGQLDLESRPVAVNAAAIAALYQIPINRLSHEGSPLLERRLLVHQPRAGAVADPTARLQPEVVDFLLARTTVNADLARFVEIDLPVKSYATWDDAESLDLARVLARPASLTFVYTRDAHQDAHEIRRAARAAGRPLFMLKLDRVVTTTEFGDLGEIIRRLSNLTRLHRGVAAVVIDTAIDSGGDRTSSQAWLVDEFTPATLFVLTSNPESPLKNLVHRFYSDFTASAPTGRADRPSLWRLEMAERGLNLPEDAVARVESMFPFTLSKIERVLGQLALEPGGATDYQSIAAICRRQSSRVLEQLSRRIEPKYRWDDLMLPPAGKLKLAEIYHYIAGRGQTERDWNLRARHNRGHGVTVVLKGVSGTGKTMAAEVLAAELGLDLYQVDLASLTSKFVGETEKNLSRVFQAAREASGILLFDEGEVLFSQRTEVSSSQDKYANLEVNYLLQELEAFDGIVIISTNHARSIDTAFLRRVTFDLEIPRPDEATREAIWRAHLAGGLPVAADVDFAFLARLPAAGGSIRNIMKQATSIASQHGEEIRMDDILHAVKREFTKVGLPIERDVFGDAYWPIVSAEWEAIHARKRQKNLLRRDV